MNDEAAAAFRSHQAGDLVAAARGYQAVLVVDPSHADALHLLGVVRHQQGQPAAAVELIGDKIWWPSTAQSSAGLHEGTDEHETAPPPPPSG